MKIALGLHPDFLGPVEQTLGALDETYPRARFAEVRLFDKHGDRSLAHVEGHAVVLNALWFARPRAALDEAALEGRTSLPFGMPLWHGGMGEPEHLLTHEFGHVLAASIEGSSPHSEMMHARAVAEPSLAVSGYALVDPDEWWAETFAALRLGCAGSPQVAELEAFLAFRRAHEVTI